MTVANFAARLGQAKLLTKDDIVDFVRKTNFDEKLININRKVTVNKARHVEVKNKLDYLSKVKIISRKGLTKDLINKYSILNGAKYFSSNRLQNHLVFISVRYIYWIIKDGSDSKFESWGSTGTSQESIKNSHTSDILQIWLVIINFKKVEFKGIYLKQDSESCLHKNLVNLYISYDLDTWSRDINTDFTLDNCSFGAINLIKSNDPDKRRFSSYGIGFDVRSHFSWSEGSWGKNVVIFGADMSPYVHVDYKKNILVLG